jgi:hypothetical protein
MGPTVIRNSKLYDQIQEGEQFLLDQMSASIALTGWTIYEQPHLNGDRPDFVLCHPEKGIVIIEVKDWRLNSQHYKSPGLVLGNDGNWYNKNPQKQVKKYKDNLLQFISKQYLSMEERYNSNSYAMIETVIYFHYADAETGRAFCGNYPESYVTVIGREQVKAIGDNQLRTCGIKTFNLERSFFAKDGFLQLFVNDLNRWMNPSDYHTERLQPIKLLPDQKPYLENRQNSYRRLSGVAGSGKSLILATKAAAMLQQSNRVLVLTYNITLRHYLRDLISQQFGVGNRKHLRDDLVILHFHDFIKKVAEAHEIDLPESNGEDFELRWIHTINKIIGSLSLNPDMTFDAILIDEGQDFKREWILFLKSFFTKKSEFFIFYDVDQDLYGRQKEVWIEDMEQTKGLGFRGRPGKLKVTRRLPGLVVQTISLLRNHFGEVNKEEIQIPDEQLDFFTELFWFNIDATKNSKYYAVYNELQRLLNKGVKVDDIAILTTHENTGLEIVNNLKNYGFSLAHVFDMTGTGSIQQRRKEKWKFQPGAGRLKVCSVHSFKGWESSHIIFVLDSPILKQKEELISGFKMSQEFNIPSGSINPADLPWPLQWQPVMVQQVRTEDKKDFNDNIKDLLFIALSRVRYHESMDFCSFTCLNFMEEHAEIEKILK